MRASMRRPLLVAAVAPLRGARAFSAAASQQSGHFHRSDFSGQGSTGIYEPGLPPNGPLGAASPTGAPKVIPKELKNHLDQFVVGQERAKKKLSTAIYNHYQRIQELERRQKEQAELDAQARRRALKGRHPVEDDDLYHVQNVGDYSPQGEPPDLPPLPPSEPEPSSIVDRSPLGMDKSNVLLLGPSGVGKTLMVKTLARILDVPFSISNCTSFTQAGYIGEDVEACVQRLLAAADYDVAAAERGIIILDEIDKIATAKMSSGKDVGGEGVQQALLGIIEGTTVQLQAKQERGSNGRPSGPPGNTSGFPPGGFDASRGFPPSSFPPNGKGEVFNVRTDNILFICAGAFVNLPKIILERISRGSIGFGASVRSSKPDPGTHESMMKGEGALFKKHLPFYVPDEPEAPSAALQTKLSQQMYNMLDLVEPSDLQKYGMIPELIGRIPSLCAVSALDEEALVRVLTEPKNSLLSQYEQLFRNSGIELRFTSGALREVAKRASNMGTGARGLRTVIERMLEESMFETPGSFVKHVLITKDVAQLKSPPVYFQRGQSHSFNATLAQEEDEWEGEMGLKEGAGTVGTFQEYRNQGLSAGTG